MLEELTVFSQATINKAAG